MCGGLRAQVRGRYEMLVRRFDRKECGEWRANSHRGEKMIGMFATIFQKFGPAGIVFYFGDAFRKLAFQVCPHQSNLFF